MEMIRDHCLRNACSYFYTGIKVRYSTDLNTNSNIMQEKEIRIHYNDIIGVIFAEVTYGSFQQ
ncbi:hypothetical protein EfsSVR2332_04020 [Enterococcus faecalis]|uniref:Uncharacterized protein n=1 Tax=Enterococcus faecalis TaxID=1351 RepID=A0AC59HL47_ENTFL|nr:hypothetical protein EfsSVR2085_03690 [Enterococcus faecalis]BDQ59313.1 hypothetical protein EfsSVR2331_34380 [Enterococcus faecalis]BDQ60324.1 hypothetical protein EfsSVR2332_04020 [Enterococcus faecalis]